MLVDLENGDIEIVHDPDLGRTHFVHKDLGTFRPAVKEDAEY